MSKSTIEWTESTWNPITGCTKISLGCQNCYAERMALRLQAMGQEKYKNGFKLTLHEDVITEPLTWKKPSVVFVNSMSDLFHEDVPDDFIFRLFDVMKKAEQHTFQILTKRAERLFTMSPGIQWPNNVWMGVTVEHNHYVNRIDLLRKTNAQIKFLSLEPLLGPISDLNLEGINWVIVGGESGPGSRPINPNWVRDIRDKCLMANVAFFFKQWGGIRKKKNGRILDSKVWSQTPILHTESI